MARRPLKKAAPSSSKTKTTKATAAAAPKKKVKTSGSGPSPAKKSKTSTSKAKQTKSAKPATAKKAKPAAKATPKKVTTARAASAPAKKTKTKTKTATAAKAPKSTKPAASPKTSAAKTVAKKAEKAPKASASPVFKPKAMPTVGSAAPNFNLPSSHGGNLSLKSYRGAKNVVLYFYPKDDTPGCTVQACKFRDDLSGYQEQDAVVLGVSADDLTSHGRFTDKFNLSFPLLSDTSTATAQSYGVWVEKNMYGKKKLGIQRATFLIGKDGKIAHIWPKVSVEGHSDEVLEALRQLNGGTEDGTDDEDAEEASAGNDLDDDADDHVPADDDDETPAQQASEDDDPPSDSYDDEDE